MHKITRLFSLLLWPLVLSSCVIFIDRFTKIKDSVQLHFFDFDNRNMTITGEITALSSDEYPSNKVLKVFTYEEKGYVFPSEINSGTIFGFFYECKAELNGRDYYISEFYLEWKMDETTFNSEIDRISSITTWCDKSPKYTTDLFSLPSYVSIYNFYGEFEYAIIDEANFTIHYIYLFDVVTYENVIFPSEYHPIKMLYDSDIDMSDEQRDYLYSMYMLEYFDQIKH